MDESRDVIAEVLRESRCMDFLRQDAKETLGSIRKAVPGAAAFLSEEAEKCLEQNYFDRMETLFQQALWTEIRGDTGYADPVGMILGKPREKAARNAAEALYQRASGEIEAFLAGKYPLLGEYKNKIRQNYTDSIREFLQAFADRREEISRRFFGGKKIHWILKLSAGGSDVHRNGRCVLAVVTDAGTVYYKPHDCGIDSLYHEIVAAWFSDCTAAADVVEGKGYAFVSCLEHEPVNTEEDIASYYRNFGMLSALFHGLGSTDMHQENIIACGAKPACADVETILCPGLVPDSEESRSERRGDRLYLESSLIRTAVLPVRDFQAPLFSPLYGGEDGSFACLPVLEGKPVPVTGYEENFIQGFGEGYARVLRHREEILEIIGSRREAALRSVLKNTRYYCLIRDMLYQPKYLKDTETRLEIREKLRRTNKSPDEKVSQKMTQYEWDCLLNGDIPYYCSAIDGRDLCGASPEMVVCPNFFRSSPQETAKRFLSRLSGEEKRFETELIRFFFRHAPVDEQETDRNKTEIRVGERIDADRLEAEISGILKELRGDLIHTPDGEPFWLSTSVFMNAMTDCGNLTCLADAAQFCAGIMRSGLPAELRREAADLAGMIVRRMEEELGSWEKLGEGAEDLQAVIPPGRDTGFGGLLQACRGMNRAGIRAADSLCARLTDLVFVWNMPQSPRSSAAEGTAGLLLGLSALPATEKADAGIRLCAERLLESESAAADFPRGLAGTGAALCAAYSRFGEDRYGESALAAFERILSEYDSQINGWRDGSIQPKWLAPKEPCEAGIYLASAFALDCLSCAHEGRGKDPAGSGVCARLMEKARSAAEISLECLMKRDRLLQTDTLDQGNALWILALLRAGETEKANGVLSAMLRRKKEKGTFIVNPPGIRSTFDASFWMGSVGIGFMMTFFSDAGSEKKQKTE